MNPWLAYVAGLLTLPVGWLLLALWEDVQQCRKQGLGKGIGHECQVREDDGLWHWVLHYHQWPSFTPWWFIRAMEPVRLRACLRKPNYRPDDVPADVN